MLERDDLLKDINGNDFIDMNNHSDWVEFFLIFSRFEYALKRSGYVKENRGYIEADWSKFGKYIEPKTEFTEITEAKKYLLERPPRKRILENGKLSWEAMNNLNNDVGSLIRIIKAVRNNLFHGGKYPNPVGPVKDLSRDKELIEHSITVLKHLLCLSPEVKGYYFDTLE